MSHYVVVVSCEASFCMPPSEVAEFRFSGPPFPGASVRIFTTYSEIEHEPIPQALLLECRLETDSIESATAIAQSMTTLLLPALGFAANATWPDPVVQITYDVSPECRQHELRATPSIFRRDFVEIGCRVLPIEAANQVFQSMMNHPDAIRIHRALVHYNEALAHWASGRELRVVESLYISSEVLGPVARRHELASGATEKDLLLRWSDVIAPRRCPKCKHEWTPSGQLDGAAVRKIVYSNDTDLLKKARMISDGLEHGFADFPWMQSESKSIRDALCRRLRASLLQLLGIAADTALTLTSAPFDNPKREDGFWRTAHILLTGPHDGLAPEGFDHPHIGIAREILKYKLDPSGTVQITMKETLQVKIADDCTWQSVGFSTGDRTINQGIEDVEIIKATVTVPVPSGE